MVVYKGIRKEMKKEYKEEKKRSKDEKGRCVEKTKIRYEREKNREDIIGETHLRI